MSLKKYVNSNIIVNNLNFTEQARFARFNKYVDLIEEKYEDKAKIISFEELKKKYENR